MKKLLLSIVFVSFCSVLSTNAQSLYVPSGSVGTSSNNNVGIGTSTPSTRLEVAGVHYTQSATLRLNSHTSPSPAYNTGLEMGYHGTSGTFNKTFSITNFKYPACGSGKTVLSNTYADITFYGSRIGIGTSPVSCSGSGYFGDIVMGYTGITELLVGNGYYPGPSTTETLQSGYKLGVNGNAYVTGTLTLGAKVSTFSEGFPYGYSLYVSDGIMAEKLKIAVKTSADWADYVFAKDYQLKTLEEVETYINENNHLPDVPSAEEVVESGIDVAQMDALLLQKIEELTLYVIQLKAELKALKQ